MKKPKIIILTSQVISEREFKRFGIDTIEAKSKLQIFDFTSILQPKNFDKQLNSCKEDLNILFIRNLSHLFNLKNHFEESDLIISILGNQNELNNFIFRFIKLMKRRYV